MRVLANTEIGVDLEAIVASITAAGGIARPVTCDVTDTEAVQSAFVNLDRVDILVNNAGTAIGSSLLDLETEAFDVMLSLNCRVAVLVAQAAARLMSRDGGGVIINLSSTFGKMDRPIASLVARLELSPRHPGHGPSPQGGAENTTTCHAATMIDDGHAMSALTLGPF
ncbi:MAG: SDR family oxidoreductase [Actinomycetia bacterium]|nr:SDR family oxidoreductase [Actinomycetes bacterium]MCP4228364.1 SDR family oxidoreductase [Actinomycetes bacterium]MCP5035551.1 SDR family oxidoreductase [Actinomycetes bacterium]